jgi:CDP-paratose 2-epimerase
MRAENAGTPDTRTVVITGSSGLIGSAVATYFHEHGFVIHGFDNNQRAVFFGPEGDTRWNQRRLESALARFHHHEIDVRAREQVLSLIESIKPSGIIHCAAQPSHDRAATIPFDDFDVNAAGTLNLLEAARRYCTNSPFVYLSTNKVYGDGPNLIPLKEEGMRWAYDDAVFDQGISETFSIDQARHSLFGASKLAADVMVQEYGRYFGMPTCCLRCGCLTGPNHSGVELHGFLSYLVRCNLEGRQYRIFGHKGKQVRDNLHADDVARFIMEFYQNPRVAEVYNLGGGVINSCSILEAFDLARSITGKEQVWTYLDQPRLGDHICYYSDLRKARGHYPQWAITKSLRETVEEIVASWRPRLGSAGDF